MTTPGPDGAGGAGSRPSLIAAAVIAAATASAFWGWIGWDTTRWVGPDRSLQGPLEGWWQTAGFLATALLIAVVSGLAGKGRALVVAMTATLTASTTVWVRLYAGPGLGGQGGVGVMFTLAATFVLSGGVALLTDKQLRREIVQGPDRGSRGHQGCWVWTAPATWPDPPVGWTPPPGWMPDPAWPPPPPDHVYWQLRPIAPKAATRGGRVAGRGECAAILTDNQA